MQLSAIWTLDPAITSATADNKQIQPTCGTGWLNMVNQRPHAADL